MSRNYQESKIYKLSVIGELDCYIGSTTKPLAHRLAQHKFAAQSPTQKQSAACVLFALGDVAIELVEEYSCTTIEELRARERYWIEETPTAANKNIPGRSIKENHQDNAQRIATKNKEWREKNKEHVDGYTAKYREENAEKIKASKSAYRQQNKEKIKEYKNTLVKCDICGEETSNGNMWRHKKKHQ